MKLFVAKLNREAVESDLLSWFGAMGPVKSVKVVMDRDTGQSKCFGFVEMENAEDGGRAISEMNGKEYMGFRMVVKEAEDRPPRSGGNSPGGPMRSHGGREDGSDRSTNPSTRHEDSRTQIPSSGSGDRKKSHKKKSASQKPDKYSDGPRQTKMKKSRGGGGSKGWEDFDEDY